MIRGQHIVLGVTGSVACYKAVQLASNLVKLGALVDVILTESAAQFVTPLQFRSLTHRPVVTSLWDLNSELAVEHVALAERAAVVVVAPATAHSLNKLAAGLADDPLGCTVLATTAPLVLAPAMESHMYANAVTQESLARLRARGALVVEPESGRLASGAVGQGRLADLERILDAIRSVLAKDGPLAGRHVVVTAGGTREPIDPVRYITNRSSGKMGYALATAARDQGARVTLITTPGALTALRPPAGARVITVETAREMHAAVREAVQEADALIMAAAVADYRVDNPAEHKIKKTGDEGPTLRLIKNPDILASTTGDFVRIGFAAESQAVIDNAAEKLRKKNLDLIVANDILAPDAGFAVDTNRVVILDRDGGQEYLPLMSKGEVADQIMARLAALLRSRA